MPLPVARHAAGWFTRWASGLRFPRLLALTVAIFVVDLLVPDLLPFVDEVILGLLSILLASMKSRRADRRAATVRK